MAGFEQFDGWWGPRAELAMDTLAFKDTAGIPSWMVHVMDYPFMEQLTGHAAGDYVKDPDSIYLKFQSMAGCCTIDQYLADNPLSMRQDGYDSGTARGATTGVHRIVLDGIEIDSPEAVVKHMETAVFPNTAQQIAMFADGQAERVRELIAGECRLQQRFGCDILKVPYSGFQSQPYMGYYSYGYENYFMAYALYPEVIERHFAQQADLATLYNRQAAEAIFQGRLPRMVRLDHDMADSRGTLVDIRSLDRIWFPHFARCIQPLLDAGVRLVWHCDGNLMDMVPRLIECGVSGFQGFQYEDGMDYERICRLKARDGSDLFILAGVSVTRTLPFGAPQDVRDQLRWLVQAGPRRGLVLGCSSSVAPNTNRQNILTLIEGLNHYRVHGRQGL